MAEPLILDRYRLLERLAAGGSAEVWRARDEQLGRDVAVKRLHPHLVPDEASRKRLAAEARAAAGLSHPVIVGIYDVDAEGEAPALVMELVDGESLAARITRAGPLPPRDAANVAADVADALFHAHQLGVIHRDVKPGNVLLASDGRTRLVDFGIAHSLATAAERLTLTGTVIGTLHAMAPEQLSGGPITPRTDLYGLGVVLHEALTGRPPYPATSPVALSDLQRAGPPDLAGVEPGLAGVIAACLAFDPTARPLHAGAVAAALRAWLAGDPAPALAIAPGAPETIETLPRRVVSPSVSRAARAERRLPPVWPIAALVLLLALGGLAFAMLGDEPPATRSSPTLAPTTEPTAAPTPTPQPAWLAKLLEEVAKECGPGVAAELEPQLAGMSEQDAKREAEAAKEACKESREGDGEGNGGQGNGGDGTGDGGEGRGRGNDD